MVVEFDSFESFMKHAMDILEYPILGVLSEVFEKSLLAACVPSFEHSICQGECWAE